MIATYILILCFSTLLASWACVRLWTRLGAMLGMAGGHMGACALVPAIAFLIVVAAPASLLFFASVLLGVFSFYPALMAQPRLRIGALLMAVGIITFLLHPPSAPALVAAPYAAVVAASIVLWLAFILGMGQADAALATTGTTTILACLPIAFVPLFLGHGSGVAIDAALLSCAWFGALWAGSPSLSPGAAARWVNHMLLGYLALAAAWQGAWPLALVSVLIAIGGGFYARHQARTAMLGAFPRA